MENHLVLCNTISIYITNNDFIKGLSLPTLHLLFNARGIETFFDVKNCFNLIELHFEK